MTTKFAGYLLAGLVSTSVFAQTKPMYIGVTEVFNQGDLRKFAGGSVNSFAWEAGYEAIPAKEGIGLNVYGRYMRTFGDPRYGTGFPTNGVKLMLDTSTFGVDLTYATPVKGLTPYLGMNVNYFDGAKSNAFQTPPLAFEDAKAKLGIRAGIQYKFTPSWSVAVDYNFAEWRSANKESRIPGVNPMNPSWLGVSLRYNFAY